MWKLYLYVRKVLVNNRHIIFHPIFHSCYHYMKTNFRNIQILFSKFNFYQNLVCLWKILLLQYNSTNCKLIAPVRYRFVEKQCIHFLTHSFFQHTHKSLSFIQSMSKRLSIGVRDKTHTNIKPSLVGFSISQP